MSTHNAVSHQIVERELIAQFQVGGGVGCGYPFAHSVLKANRWTDEHPVLLAFQQVKRPGYPACSSCLSAHSEYPQVFGLTFGLSRKKFVGS
jgi:hypothetical protein